MKLALALVLAACGSSAPAVNSPAAAPSSPAPAPVAVPASPPEKLWPVPAGWRSEVIPFPLEFAPAIPHSGLEDLRFPPGMFDPSSPDYWSYTFTWHTDDAAELDASALGRELTAPSSTSWRRSPAVCGRRSSDHAERCSPPEADSKYRVHS